MDKKGETLATYNTSAEAMAEKFNRIGPRKKDIARALSHIGKSNPIVLEIGCGNGRDAREILRYTPHYTGIDYSEKFIAMAKKAVPNASFKVEDLETYVFPDHLDVVFSFASLLHSKKEKIEEILNRVYAALNPGGVFFISLKYGPYRESREEDAWGPRTFYYYTPKDIKALAGEKYKTVYEDIHDTKLKWQKWFEIILQK